MSEPKKAVQQSEAFWDAMAKSAELARGAPPWKQAGINLSEQNFATFRGESVASVASNADAESAGASKPTDE